MSQIAQKLADELAAAAIAHIEKTGDEDVVTLITKTIGDSSQTLQEAFVTSVRVQRAALRANRMLQNRIIEFEEGGAPADPAATATPAPAEQPKDTKPAPTGPWDLDEE